MKNIWFYGFFCSSSSSNNACSLKFPLSAGPPLTNPPFGS